MKFSDLSLSPEILSAIAEKGYTEPTPIQAGAIPTVLQGRDLMGIAQTGTGKTAAFAIPTVHRLQQMPKSKAIKALVITPTRELAIQITENFEAYGKNTHLKHTVIFGGVKQHSQVRKIKAGIDILVATPGRLLDLIGQGVIRLKNLEVLILDEADRMLDMGFIRDIKKLLQHVPEKRQTLMFSATMPKSITSLANTFLTNPERVEVAVVSSTADTVAQELYLVDKANKKSLLAHVLKKPEVDSALVFTRTKHGANKLVKYIERQGITAEAIHGNKSQTARQKALANFKAKRTSVLVATDIASRGIDVRDLAHVINYEIPNEPETYVHRIGRTGRAKSTGTAISLCDNDEKAHVVGIHKLIKKSIPLVEDHPFPMVNHDPIIPTHIPKIKKKKSSRGKRRHF